MEILQRCRTSKFLEKDKLKGRFIKTGRLLSEPPQYKTPNEKIPVDETVPQFAMSVKTNCDKF
jgi:hypothetical protein